MVFNGYTMNKHQNAKNNFTISFNDVNVQKALVKDAVSRFVPSKYNYAFQSSIHCHINSALSTATWLKKFWFVYLFKLPLLKLSKNLFKDGWWKYRWINAPNLSHQVEFN
jgi:hypothetical protein